MKTFDYKCLECGKIIEAEKPPECCGELMVKIYSPPAVIYKGGGFTTVDHTDYIKKKIKKQKEEKNENLSA